MIWNAKYFIAILTCCLLLTILQGCGEGYKIIDEGYDVKGIGVVSDTTALLAVRYWEQFEDDCCYPGGRGDGYNYEGWGLKLVDVRFHHVYWEATTSDQGLFNADQLSDSMMVYSTGQQLWFWKIGQSKPITVKLANGEIPIATRIIRPWSNGNILVYSAMRPRVYHIIDTLKKTINLWAPPTEYSWIDSSEDIKFENNKYYSLRLDALVCRVYVLADNADTLNTMTFEFKKSCPYSTPYFVGGYVEVSQSIYSVDFSAPNRDAVYLIYPWNLETNSGNQKFWIADSRRGFVNSNGTMVGY